MLIKCNRMAIIVLALENTFIEPKALCIIVPTMIISRPPVLSLASTEVSMHVCV